MFYILPFGAFACALQFVPNYWCFFMTHITKALISGITYTMVPVILIDTVPGDIHHKYLAQPVSWAYQG